MNGSRELECWALGVKTPAHKTNEWCAYFGGTGLISFKTAKSHSHLARFFFLLSSVPCPIKFTQNSILLSGEYVFARGLTSKTQSSILTNLFCFESFFQSNSLLHGFPNQKAAALKWKKKKIIEEEQEDKLMAAVSKISMVHYSGAVGFTWKKRQKSSNESFFHSISKVPLNTVGAQQRRPLIKLLERKRQKILPNHLLKSASTAQMQPTSS